MRVHRVDLRALFVALATLVLLTGVVAVVPPAAEAQGGSLFTDDFSGSSNSGWQFHVPAVAGRAAEDTPTFLVSSSAAVISAPAGFDHNLWEGGANTAPRLRQEGPFGSVDVEAKFDSVFDGTYQIQGIVVEEDANNFLRFEIHRGPDVQIVGDDDHAKLVMFVTEVVNGVVDGSKTWSSVAFTGETLPDSQYVRVRRSGQNWEFWHGTDTSGVEGTPDHTLTGASLTTARWVGPYAGNIGVGQVEAPGFVGSVDYFWNRQGSRPSDGADVAAPVVSNVAVQDLYTGGIWDQSVEFTWDTDEPATSSVRWGLTDTYLDGNKTRTFATQDHSLTVGPLSCGTTYHYQLNPVDGVGNVAATADATFTTPACPSSGFSDDFAGGSLDGRWFVRNELGTGVVSLGAGFLHLSVPEGIVHDLTDVESGGLRVVQPLPQQNYFEVEAQFESPVSQPSQVQGIVLERDSFDLFRFDVYYDHDTEQPRAFVGYRAKRDTPSRNIDKGFNLLEDVALPESDTPIRLRVTRHGTTKALKFETRAANESAWRVIHEETTVDMPFARVGVSAINARSNLGTENDPNKGVTPHTALVENFWINGGGSVSTARSTSGGPSMTFFDGDGEWTAGGTPVLDFGASGQAQPDVNVRGNITNSTNLTSFTYTVNNQTTRTLGVGTTDCEGDSISCTQRLAYDGDFNAEIPVTDLNVGANTVQFRAIDTAGNLTVRDVTVNWNPVTATLPYTIDWSTVTDISDVAQLIDGNWRLEGNGTDRRLRVNQIGYDRLVAIGDDTWDAYEAIIPVEIHHIDDYVGSLPPSGAAGLGLIPNWIGHKRGDYSQPKWGFKDQLGAIAWYRLRRGVNIKNSDTDEQKILKQCIKAPNLDLYDSTNTIAACERGELQLNTPYVFKVRVHPDPANAGVNAYWFEVWNANQTELLHQVSTGHGTGPDSGSLILVAHHMDVSFGNITVTELTPAQWQTPANVNLPPPPAAPLNVPVETLAGTSLRSQGFAADPVNTATGNFTDTWTDIGYPGVDSLLGFSRTYNAQDTTDGPLGQGWSVTYDDQLSAAGNNMELTTLEGRRVTFVDDGNGGFEQPEEFSGTLTANGGGTHSITFVDGTVADYDTNGRLAAVTDWAGNGVTITRDGAGNATTVIGTSGRTMTFTYDTNDHITQLATSDGQTMTFTYNAAGHLTGIDHTGNSWDFGVDSQGRIDEIRDGENRLIVTNVYDTTSRVVEQSTPHGKNVFFAYDDTAGVTTVTDEATGDVNTYAHSAGGRLIDIKDPIAARAQRTYDTNGYLASATDRLGNVITYTNNDAGQTTAVTSTDGTATTNFDTDGRPTQIVDVDGTQTLLTYSGTSRIPDTITTAAGTPAAQTTEITATSSGLITAIKDPANETTAFTYDTAGNVLTAVDPTGATTTFTYDTAGRLLTETDPAGITTTNTYGPTGLLLTQNHPATGTVTFAYDDAGNVVSETNDNGDAIISTYNPAGQLATVTDRTGGVTTYTYNDAGELATVTDPTGNTTTYTYSELGRLSGIEDPLGNLTSYVHDLEGRVALEIDPLGRSTSFTYDTLGRNTATTDQTGGRYSTQYNNLGQITTVTDPTGITTTYTYDTAGRPVTETTPAGVTTTTYDTAGRVATVTDPLGNTTTYTYDQAGRPLTVTDPEGGVTTTTYDTAGRVIKVTNPIGDETAYTYDTAGRPHTVTDPAGNVTTTTYDNLGRITAVTDGDNNTTTYAYDAGGRQTTITDPDGNTTTTVYDPAGRVTSIAGPDGLATTFGYDTAGRQTLATNPAGGVTATAYDPAGRVTAVTDPVGRTTAYTYDPAGRQTLELTPTGANLATTYDLAGRVLTQTDLAGGTTTYTYDTAGRVATVTDPVGNVTTNAYDAASRVTTRTFGDGTIAGYGYDNAGRRTSLTDPTGVTNYTYDAASNLLTKTDPTGAGIEYRWADGLLDELVYPDNTVAAYTYTNANELSSVSHPHAGIVSYTYTNDGQLAAASLPGGQARTYTYDNENRLTNYTQTIDAGANDATLVYDPADRLATATIGGTTTSYTYDDASQLTTAGATTYTYDNGRRTGVDTGTEDTTYTYDDASRLTSITNNTATNEQVTFVVSNATTPTTEDQLIIDRLENTLGYTVTLVDDDDPETTTGADLLLLSQSAGHGKIADKYYDVTIPVLTMSPRTWDEHGYATAQGPTSPYVTTTSLLVDEPGHPIMGGFDNTFTGGDTKFGYARDNKIVTDGHILAAPKTTRPEYAAIVVFEPGDQDKNGDPIPTRRALIGIHREAIDNFTETGGWQLFDNTIEWLNPPPTPVYDNAGRLTNIDNTTITYNTRGLPTRYTTTDGTGVTTQDRTYNGDGTLTDITITAPDGTTETHHLVWDELAAIPQILTQTIDGTTNNYLYGTMREGALRGGGVDWFAHNHLGSTAATTATADLVADTSYSSWGTPTGGIDPSTIGFGYRGELHTGHTIHLRNRDYHPQHAIFTTLDPLASVPGTPTTANPYHYTNNNPLNLTDPLGLRPTDNAFQPAANPETSGYQTGQLDSPLQNRAVRVIKPPTTQVSPIPINLVLYSNPTPPLRSAGRRTATSLRYNNGSDTSTGDVGGGPCASGFGAYKVAVFASVCYDLRTGEVVVTGGLGGGFGGGASYGPAVITDSGSSDRGTWVVCDAVTAGVGGAEACVGFDGAGSGSVNGGRTVGAGGYVGVGYSQRLGGERGNKAAGRASQNRAVGRVGDARVVGQVGDGKGLGCISGVSVGERS